MRVHPSGEIATGRNSSIQLAFRSVSRKAPSPWRTLDTFPTEVRWFRIPIEEIRISPVYSGATGFCCKRIPFVPRNSPGSERIQAVIYIIDYSRDSFTGSYVSFGLLKLRWSCALSHCFCLGAYYRLQAVNNQKTLAYRVSLSSLSSSPVTFNRVRKIITSRFIRGVQLTSARTVVHSFGRNVWLASPPVI